MGQKTVGLTAEQLRTALDALAARTGLPAVARFAEAMAVAVDRGTPLAGVLHAQAADAREAGRRALIESGARREVLMMVPVVFLILPVTVLFAFWPGVVVVAVALAPPGTTASVTSGGTSNRRSVAEPVAVPWGSIRIVYVPVAASVLVSTNRPLVPKAARGASRVPSGFLIVT